MKQLETIIERPSKFAIGLMSGTSVDGIDAVLVEISGSGLETRVREIAFVTVPYDDETRDRLLRLASGNFGGSEELCRMNVLLGVLSADACEAVCEKAGFDPRGVSFVGSHGHTAFHAPVVSEYLGHSFRATLQIGEASEIAERLGCPVVSDFRARDVAAGGQGAPLVPYTEFLLYRDEARTVALQNIGGIGNVTILPNGGALSDVLAFDTGPGNMIIDALAARHTAGALRYDEGGAIASSGVVSESLLAFLLDDPYFEKLLPKTTGRETYGASYVDRLIENGRSLGLPMQDMIRTATRFTAETIAIAISRFSPRPVDRLIVGGGGSRNPVLMRDIAERLPNCEVMTNEGLGLNSDSKEAVAFAVLANETIHGRCNTALGATGARHPVVMGKISL